ncbi:MAG: TetR/AcrR family transcriptional regulator [Leptospira sp.]|nr:TetR/AcrR family transcriptional regulator [Leptospira sp.]
MKNINSKKTYHHGDLKKALIAASLRLLEEEGYQSFSLRKVAKLAGVSQAAPYRHYKDQESLIADVACEGFVLLAEKLQKIRNKFKNSSLLQFRESGLAYVEFALRHPDLFQIMYGNQIQNHSEYPTLRQSEDLPFQILLDIISETKKEGRLVAVDIQKTTIAAWTMVHGIAMLLLGKQVMFRSSNLKEAKQMTKELIEQLYTGLKKH